MKHTLQGERLTLEEERAHKLEMKLYRVQNSVWLFFGFATIVACLTFFFDESSRTQTATAYQLSLTYQYIWNVSWGVGGILIIVGIWFWLSRVEVIGHVFFGGAILTSALAIFLTVRAFIPTLLTLIGFAAASFFRAYWILRILPRRGS